MLREKPSGKGATLGDSVAVTLRKRHSRGDGRKRSGCWGRGESGEEVELRGSSGQRLLCATP